VGSSSLPVELMLGWQIDREMHCFLDVPRLFDVLVRLLLVVYLWAAIVLKYACEGSEGSG
jgi:hypothetical protein